MSFLYASYPFPTAPPFEDVPVMTARLALNIKMAPASAESAHTPHPSDPYTVPDIEWVLLQGVAVPELATSVTGGRLACAPAVWELVYRSRGWYGGINGVDTILTQVMGIALFYGPSTPFALIDGSGFPFTPPDWEDRGPTPPGPPSFRLVWNPAGGDVIDLQNPSGGQVASSSWNPATSTLTITPATYHPPQTFPEHALELAPAPALIDAPALVIPPAFGAATVGAEPVIDASGLQIPVRFGRAAVTRSDPEEPPPPDPDTDPPPVPGGSTVKPAPGLPTSGALPVAGTRVVGGR